MNIRSRSFVLLLASAIAAAMSIVALCVVLLARIDATDNFRRLSAQNCKSINVVLLALSQTVQESKDRVLADPSLSKAERDERTAQIDVLLNRFRTRSC